MPSPHALVNTLPASPAKIAVAMSGGVDSSMVAYLLAQQGHQLVGFTAWTLNGPGKCCNDALVNAGRVCEQLGIPYDTVDLRAEFFHYVMDHYHRSYEAGLTPNPCVECNRYVKWDKLVAYAKETWDVDYVATGHYAQVFHGPTVSRLFRSADTRKDQTYMMARVFQDDLRAALFPLGNMVKSDVVAMAQAAQLPTAHSKESQDVCFVLDGQANYLQGVFGKRPGPIIDVDTGKTLGQHSGYFSYTLGQRKGLSVAAGRPVYVVRIDKDNNTVYVGDAQHLETRQFTVRAPHWLRPDFPSPSDFPLRACVKIRYNSPPCLATVTPAQAQPDAMPDTLDVLLDTPQMAVTPGQVAAFYDEGFQEVFGSGYIEAHLAQAPFDPSREVLLPDLHCSVLPGTGYS